MRRVIRKIDVYMASGEGVMSPERMEAFKCEEIAPDMLRYDQAFVNPQRFPKVVVFVTYSVKGRGTHQGKPTIGRWKSFLIQLDLIAGETESAVVQDLVTHAADWISYRHRIDDNTKIEPITYKQFIAEETN